MCCVVREPSAKFGQHAGNLELSVHNEEWIVCVCNNMYDLIRVFFCISCAIKL